MIEKQRRITRRTSIFSPTQRTVLFGRFLTMTHYGDNPTHNSHFTVTVSKKISKKATERNYLKRIVYEAVKQSAMVFDHVFGGNIVFSFKKTPNTPSFKEVQADILYFLSKK